LRSAGTPLAARNPVDREKFSETQSGERTPFAREKACFTGQREIPRGNT
jgi:hypothetical protein